MSHKAQHMVRSLLCICCDRSGLCSASGAVGAGPDRAACNLPVASTGSWSRINTYHRGRLMPRRRRRRRKWAPRLRAAGFPRGRRCRCSRSAPRKGNLVARLHWLGARKPDSCWWPLSTSCLPTAKDWTVDPFNSPKQDGYWPLRLRGSSLFDKYMAAISFVTNLNPLQEGGAISPAATSSSRF